MDRETWMTVDEVADLFKVNPETVRRWIRNQELEVLNLGSRSGGYRIRRSDVDAFARKRFGYVGEPGVAPAE